MKTLPLKDTLKSFFPHTLYFFFFNAQISTTLCSMHFIYLTSIEYLEPPINLTVSRSQSNQSEPTQGQGEHGNPPKEGLSKSGDSHPNSSCCVVSD